MLKTTNSKQRRLWKDFYKQVNKQFLFINLLWRFCYEAWIHMKGCSWTVRSDSTYRKGRNSGSVSASGAKTVYNYRLRTSIQNHLTKDFLGGVGFNLDLLGKLFLNTEKLFNLFQVTLYPVSSPLIMWLGGGDHLT